MIASGVSSGREIWISQEPDLYSTSSSVFCIEHWERAWPFKGLLLDGVPGPCLRMYAKHIPSKPCQQLSLHLDWVSLLIHFEVRETHLQWLPFLWYFLHIGALLKTTLTAEVEMLQVESNLLAGLYCSDRSRYFWNQVAQSQDPTGSSSKW